MGTRNFKQIIDAQADNGHFVCVGLDADLQKMPSRFRDLRIGKAISQFNQEIIDATCGQVCAYKPNFAFYEAHGLQGMVALQETMFYLRERAPHVAVILDAKRADIGNTNNGTRQMAFEWLDADALTLNPYLGVEAMKPFLEDPNKVLIVLCRTSNPGADEFQELTVKVTIEIHDHLYHREMPLYEYIAHRVAGRSTGWNYNGNCAVVVGATYPEQMKRVREIIGDMLILAPGIGKQGGDLKATVEAAKNSKSRGFIINSSSDILYASDGPDFAEVARKKVIQLNDSINSHL